MVTELDFDLEDLVVAHPSIGKPVRGPVERIVGTRVSIRDARSGKLRTFDADVVRLAEPRAPAPGVVARPVTFDAPKLESVERPKPARDEPYKAWLRKRPCAFCGRRPPSEVSHHGRRGVATKASDHEALPACHRCHERHTVAGRAHPSLDVLTTDQYRDRLAHMAGQMRETWAAQGPPAAM
jgi:hypothetical protein